MASRTLLGLAVFVTALGCRDAAPSASSSTTATHHESAIAAPAAPSSSAIAAVVSASAVAVVDPACPADWPCDGRAAPDAIADAIFIDKSEHRLWLFAGRRVIESYGVALGSGGPGQKHYEGDKITPIGSYRITHIVPKTRWHTYLALDYPAEVDRQRYNDLVAKGEAPPGKTAGSGIAIHGRRADMVDGVHKLVDWTLGCVAIDNDEIDAVAARVAKGTAVTIRE
jgi:hypothetical protein